MGMAEVIPGVSGGTIAFISGIYERLIQAIKSVDRTAFQLLWQRKWMAFYRKIDGGFLVTLGVGMFAGIMIGVFLITHLLENYPIPMWAFFFGLILGSAVFIATKIPRWTLSTIGLLIFGTLVAFGITQGLPMRGIDQHWAYFFAGMIAISALILPGISGSYILLIMGMYTLVLKNVKAIITEGNLEALSKTFFLGLGILIGLAIFSRILSWTFKRYKVNTYALLTGFIIGSLVKIWPWKVPTVAMNDDGEIIPLTGMEPLTDLKIIAERNINPFSMETTNHQFYLALLLFIIGLVLIYLLAKVERKEDR